MSQITLPNGWSTAPIGMLCSLENGRPFRPTDWSSKGIPIVRIQNLNNPNAPFNYFDQEYNGRYHLNGGELLFAWSGTPGTSFGAHIWYGKEAVLNQHIFRVDFDEKSIDKRFFRYAINQKLGELIDVAHGGVGLRHVTKGKFEKTEVVIPPLKEQKRIAVKLDALLARVGACREQLDRVLQILKRFRQAVFTVATTGVLSEKWREDQGENFEWEKVRIDDLLAEKPRSGYSPKAVGFQTNTRSLTLSATTSGRFNPSHSKYINKDIPKNSYLWLVPGDILIQRANTIEYVGVSAIYDGPAESFIYPDLMMKCRPNNRVLTKYLYYILSSEAVRGHLRKNASGTAGNMPKINKHTILSTPALVPKLTEQHEIVRQVEILFAFADRLEASCIAGRKRIDQLTPSLLDKAFSGELTAEWREQNLDLISGENSAEALLARIKAEKAGAVRANKSIPINIKTKAGENMKPKMIIPVAAALKAAGTPLAAQALLTQSGYSSDATTEDLERFFLDIRDQLKLGSILRERSGDNDIFTLVN